MKTSRTDNGIAIAQAVGLHVVLLVLLLAGLQWPRDSTQDAARGEPIDAELIDPSALSRSMQRALNRAPEALPEPVPAPTPAPPESLPQPVTESVTEPEPNVLPAPVPEPAPVEQERVQRNADSREVAAVPREQDARHRQAEQVELSAEQKRARALAEIRKQREAAQRELSMAEQRAQQLADARQRGAPASAPPGNRGNDDGLRAKYAAALQQAILRQWTRPDTVALGQRCKISIRQIPGGQVVDVEISPTCPYDALGRRSVEVAVLKASPLPYAGFETVFSRTLELNFVAEER